MQYAQSTQYWIASNQCISLSLVHSYPPYYFNSYRSPVHYKLFACAALCTVAILLTFHIWTNTTLRLSLKPAQYWRTNHKGTDSLRASPLLIRFILAFNQQICYLHTILKWIFLLQLLPVLHRFPFCGVLEKKWRIEANEKKQ